MDALAWLNPYRWLLAIGLAGALALGAVTWKHHYDETLREEGREEVRHVQQAAALKETQAKAKESFRRIEAQEMNQHAQDLELAAAKAAADRNGRDADRLRSQLADSAREWAARLGDSPTREELQAAGAAFGVCTDLLGRADHRAGVLASYADAARAAGLKCARDYDALRPTQ